MSILLHQLPAKRFYSKYFTLSYMHLEKETLVYMRMHGDIVNTAELPETLKILSSYLPRIFTSKCFNKKRFSFKREAKRTEIGHLLEHIVLEYLCEEKMKISSKNIVFSGVTSWDWTRDEFGTFHITIDSKVSDRELFARALEKGILLLNHIISICEKAEVKKDNKFLQTDRQNPLFA